MRRIVVSLLVTACLGCGREAGVQSADPELVPYLQEFERIALEHGTHLPSQNITLKVVEDDGYFQRDGYIAAGCCEIKLTSRTVAINKKFWDENLLRATRELLVFHELGHCLLDRDHDEGVINDSSGGSAPAPRSIMYPEIFSPWIYERRRDSYLAEMFRVRPGLSITPLPLPRHAQRFD